MLRKARPNKSCDMQDGQGSLPSTLNAFAFPAKLWRMVNNAKSNAVRWSDSGDVIFIDRQIFENQILARQSKPSEHLDTFRAKHFASFIRQLNLYGFSRASWVRRAEGVRHQFFHPYFKRGHPELLDNLKRLTVKNKIKWKAGLSAPSKPRGRPRRMYEFANGQAQDDGPERHGSAVDARMMASNTEDRDVMAVTDVFNKAPGASAPAAQQTTQCYSSYTFFPSTYSELFSAPQWSSQNFGDPFHIHPSNNYSPPMIQFLQGQKTAVSGYYEKPPFPANLQRPLNMADTCVYNAFQSYPTNGIFEQHASCLPDLKPLDLIEVIADEDMVSEVASMETH
ncbi:heat shock factor protein 5 [Synchiropus picturatus]